MEIVKIHFDHVPSTNLYAKDNVLSFSPAYLTIISATTQSEGRGKQGRFWHSPPGNIYATFCFFSPEESDPFFWTRLMSEIIQSLLQKRKVYAHIKWPNDLLVDNKKIAGILTETTPCEGGKMVMIGVGLNINLSKEMSQEIDQPVTSLYMETGNKYCPPEIIEEIAEILRDRKILLECASFKKL